MTDSKEVVSPGSDSISASLLAVDEAYNFLKDTSLSTEDVEGVDIKAVRRRVDRHIVPILLLSYTFFFIDKVLINYANVMNLSRDLKLKGNDLSNAATTYAVAYLVAQIGHGYALNKLPAAKWLSLNIVLWGITTAATAGVTNNATLQVSRVFIGAFEGGLSPSCSVVLSQWHDKKGQVLRFGVWFMGLGVGQVVGGLMSFAFQHVTNSSLAGWRIMFLVGGLFTVLVGLLAFFLIPNSPMVAPFLSDLEKAAILKSVESNRTGVLLTLIVILTCTPSGVISTYSATLIRSFGFSPKSSALLNIPSGAVAIVWTLVSHLGARHTATRWLWIVFCCLPGLLGGALMSFAPASNRAALLTGVYLVNTVVPALPLAMQWAVANVAGMTKRPFTLSLLAAAFSVGNIIGPQTFQAKDAPGYLPAKITVLAVMAGGAVCAVLLGVYYGWENGRRERSMDAVGGVEGEAREVELWRNVTDRENTEFRYVC
ncbi:High-affinity nicotinic acid transporter [Elsinoe australis]|uniref:High-affinity nicotinic acid transporter n=1 Tax=Elsinoe australis TaxID=40998 RepID=A0A2P7Z422_9PEZI|nr:High-affinity nicotinic acid transporter [Elsinoe australis]